MKQYEKKAKESFSRLVRLQGCVKTTGSTDYGKCYTCGCSVTFEQSQCGHFVSGRTNALFFEPDNSRLQCPSCNTSKGGNLDIYREKIIKELGIKRIEELESQRHTEKRITSQEFKAKFESCKSQISLIESEY
jgi:5-methylcytosine-specific restriction endonuclease McrA